ncbi:hypothetical protein VTO42DRAFT_4770 [Malbranchea cinnamomea]
MRTRPSKTTTSAPSEEDATTERIGLPLTPQKPVKTLILPSNASDDARFVFLGNPATGKQNQYYFCPTLGLYEFTLISPPASATRSILFTPSTNPIQESNTPSHENAIPVQDGYVSKLAQLHAATPVDIMFFLLPILAPSSKRTQDQKLFQPLDDMLDAQENLSNNLRNILLHPKFRDKVEKRMTAVCDTLEAGETMYRLSEKKLVEELLAKAERVAAKGLPASMEERFVRRELELPVLSIKRENTTGSYMSGAAAEDADTDAQPGTDQPQESSTSTGTSTSTPATEASSIPSATPSTPDTPLTPADTPKDAPGDSTIKHLLRLRTALSFILSSYVPAHLSAQIESFLKSPESPQDFTPLTEHLKHIATLRAEAQESRAMYNMTRKRGIEDDEDAAAARAEKKRKEEEEKRRKTGESRGVKELKKVDTSGMKKLSEFFAKAPKK